MQNIALVFWYDVGTAVINNMLNIHDNIPHIKGVNATRVKHKCTGKLEVFIIAGGGRWRCRRLSPVCPRAPIQSPTEGESGPFQNVSNFAQQLVSYWTKSHTWLNNWGIIQMMITMINTYLLIKNLTQLRVVYMCVMTLYPEFSDDKAHLQLVYKIYTEGKNKLSNTHK